MASSAEAGRLVFDPKSMEFFLFYIGFYKWWNLLGKWLLKQGHLSLSEPSWISRLVWLKQDIPSEEGQIFSVSYKSSPLAAWEIGENKEISRNREKSRLPAHKFYTKFLHPARFRTGHAVWADSV